MPNALCPRIFDSIFWPAVTKKFLCNEREYESKREHIEF